jgi:hypothetical protein
MVELARARLGERATVLVAGLAAPLAMLADAAFDWPAGYPGINARHTPAGSRTAA